MSSRYLMYLRKSRQDDPDQTVEEVLSKHETMLQEHAVKMLGCAIPEENIYREVVSGETIADRVEIKKVLTRIEDPNIVGVFVVEPSRLSRGDLNDCGQIMQAFQYTDTKIVTLMMTYDLHKKMENKFLQYDLLRGNDYLEYTKEILLRGSDAAVRRGCFLGSIPPYGYDKIKVGKNCTLVPNEDADTVRSIFDWYTREGLTPGEIAKRLNNAGIPASGGGTWRYEVVHRLLQNPHYIGKVRRYYRKTVQVIEYGEKKTKRLIQPEEDRLLADGLHPAIIDMVTWDKAQARLEGLKWSRHDRSLKNPLGGLLFCKHCGKAMIRMPKSRISAHERYQCPQSPVCYKGTTMEQVVDAVVVALEQSELPSLRSKIGQSGVSTEAHLRLIKKLEKQMEEYRQQEDTQFEMLETGRYTLELFDRRNAALHEKMEECEKELTAARATMPKKVNYEERIPLLEKAIEALKDDTVSVDMKNALLKAIVERIEYSSEGQGRGKTTVYLDVKIKL